MGNPKIHTTDEERCMEEGIIAPPSTSSPEELTKGTIATSNNAVLISKDDQSDLEERDRLINIMKHEVQHYSKEEMNMINNAKEKFRMDNNAKYMEEIESPDPLVKMKCGFIPKEGDLVGWSETEVDASIEQCACFDSKRTAIVV